MHRIDAWPRLAITFASPWKGQSVAALARTFGANAAIAGRFLPVWLATAVLVIVAAIIAPQTLQNTSWAYILPYMTILAIAALGQMLVIMQAGIDLSTPGVSSCGGNLIVAAWSLRYARENTNSLQVPPALSSWAAEKPLGVSSVFWMGAGITLAVALLLRYTAPGRRFQAFGANPRAAWMAGLRVRTHVVFAYTAAGALYAMAAILLAGIRINIDPAFGATYLLPPIAAVVIAGASLSGGLASATSTWVAALALTLLTQMLLILGLSTAVWYIVYGAAIIAGMLVSGDRVASLLGRALRPSEATIVQADIGTNPS